MGRLLFKLERKYGKYAIPNLSLILIVCYIVGYIIQFINADALQWLSLNPYMIVHGQVWRILSWVFIPPENLSFWTIIMLYFYYSIGRSMESVWGDFRYNVYIFSGIIFTILGSFIIYGIAYIQFADEIKEGLFKAEELFAYSGYVEGNNIVALPGSWFMGVSTFYICMSIFLAYASTFPNMQVLIMFIIPVRVKILGIIEVAFLGLMMILSLAGGRWYDVVIILMSLLNFLIFFFTTKDIFGKRRPSDFRRQREYRNKVRWAKVNMGREATHEGKTVITRHKCAICGRTELDGDIEFRFCTKCDGNYEYCMDHLYTHTHVKRI